MFDPDFTGPDLCSIRAAAQQAEFPDTARGVLSANGHRYDCSGPVAPVTSSIDRAIRLSTAAAVLAVAGIAAYVSYWHAYAVVRAHGETGITARLEPATIDGLVYASSMVVLYAARHRVPVPSLARWLLGLGIAATLTANMAQGWAHGPVGAVVAAWPAVSLVGSYEYSSRSCVRRMAWLLAGGRKFAGWCMLGDGPGDPLQPEPARGAVPPCLAASWRSPRPPPAAGPAPGQLAAVA